ncbi:ATP-binding protein [Pelotalea chapellei]|uniref:histidine kinase n=1 Tax=Pelotalea chapellei TaxID=44671 RepID=A0ABS5U9E3_9BACT|nr:ATP-binding protein [Pelotalea chapellei]MBT1072280.1 GAF domain-containing protein [Pelotalea chapellei]
MHKQLQQLWSNRENDSSTDLEFRQFRLICLLISLLFILLVFPINLLQKLPISLDVSIFLFGVFSLYCYRASSSGRHHTILFYIMALLLLNLAWFLNAGSAGSVSFYFFAMALYPLIFFHRKTRWFTLVLLMTNICILLLLEQLIPAWITHFHSPQDRIVNIATGLFFSGFICMILFWLILSGQRRELIVRRCTEEDLKRAQIEADEKRNALEHFLVEYRKVQDELKLYQAELEARVAIRTEQLAGSIEQLQQEIATRRTIEKELRHSKETLQLAIEATYLGTIDFYPLTGQLLCSDIARRHFGLTQNAHLNYDILLSSTHPEDRARVVRKIEEILHFGSGGLFREEFRLVGIENGRQNWLSLRGQAFYNESGVAVRLIGITRDVSREKHSEEMILRMNRFYAVLSATNQAIIYNTDSKSIFNEFCRVAVEQGGFRLAKVGLVDRDTGQVSVVAACGTTEYLEGINISVRGPEGMGPTGLSIRTGSYYVCNDFCNALITLPWHEKAKANGIYSAASIAIKQNNEVIGALSLYASEKNFFDSHQIELLQQMGADVSFAMNIIDRETRRSEAERALQHETEERIKTLEKLRHKEQMLIQQSRQAAMGEMIGNIAHQWRQPLNTLGLNIQHLMLFYDMGKFSREFLEEGVCKSMEIIQHMSQTIDDFRSYFKPDKEKVDFRVHEAVTKTISLMSASFQNNQISIFIDAQADPVICGYPNEYAQVLLNIMINARDAFLERGTQCPHITITIDQNNQSSVVTISDNAGGIQEEILEKIFDPYFTTKGPQTGTGIGLFMSKAIIEKNMGGHLSVRNIQEGAEFRVEMIVSEAAYRLTTPCNSDTLLFPA